jgi:hypothetical protein
MGRQQSEAVTVADIAAFYFMSDEQFLRLNAHFFEPGDLHGQPACSCNHVQSSTFGFTGYDFTQDRSTVNVDRVVSSCTHNNFGHNYLLKIACSTTLESVAQTPNLGLYSDFHSSNGANLDSFVNVNLRDLDKAPLAVQGRNDCNIRMVLCVRELWNERVNGKQAVHEWLEESRNHMVGALHGAQLGLPRLFFSVLQELVESKNKISQFNRQQNGLWSIKMEPETNKLKPPSMLGPTSIKMVDMYSNAVVRNENNVFSLKPNAQAHWPLRGILDDSADPNLHHFLAAIYWLKLCMDLSRQFFLARKPGKDSPKSFLRSFDMTNDESNVIPHTGNRSVG